jgi:hypothetical protein
MSQYTHQLTMLDPAILTSPYETYTRWHVITGAACCGKTTLIEMLSAKGIQVIPESAHYRVYGPESAAADPSPCMTGVLYCPAERWLYLFLKRFISGQ